MLSNAAPKPTARALEKRAKRTQEAKELRECYAAVDARDEHRCRVCGKRGSPTAVGLLERIHRHHMVYRSRGGESAPWSVLSVCAGCHALIHVAGTLRVSGDASARDVDTGELAGVLVECLVDGEWRVDGMR